MPVNDLSARQARFIAALLQGSSQAQAAEAAGVRPRQGRRWMADPRVRQALALAVGEAIAALSAQLTAGARVGLVTLLGLATSEGTPPAVQRAAARDLLALALQYHTQADLERRLSDLEGRMAEAKR
jgi:hypothetical protein